MEFENGFGIGISHNYEYNYLVYIQKSNNSFELWMTKQELRHIYNTLNRFFKDLGEVE